MPGLTRILKTDVMADLDLKGLAQVLRSQGRGRDTVLAHITPREARKLKREGGAGTINPATGLPEFEDYGSDYYDFGGAESYQAATPETYYGSAEPYYEPPDVTGVTYVTPGGSEIVPGGEGTAFTAPGLEPLSAPAAAAPAVPAPTAGPFGGSRVSAERAALLDPSVRYEDVAGRTPTGGLEPGYFERLGTSLEKSLSDPSTLARLGLGLGTGALGLLQQQRAATGAREAKRETANIGTPYRAQGQELIAQARSGELSPASMQAYQAMQAQVAQQTARQGGVGAAQGAAALERLRAQLLQNQYSFGLNVANIGDRYLAGAIASGQQGNQALMTATNQFYSTLGSMLSGPTGQSVATAVRA